jgi:hypothetical protein
MANIDTVVPPTLVAAVEGRWILGEDYRITLVRAGKGLRVHQEAEVLRRGHVVRDCEVEYDRTAHTLRFQGLGAIHRTMITLRWSDGALEYAFSSEISPGRQTHGTWHKARPVEASD